MSDWNWKAVALFLGQLGGGLALTLTSDDAHARQLGTAMIYGAFAQFMPNPAHPPS